MRLERLADCAVCGRTGEPLYRRVPDRLFGVPGAFGHSRCPSCGLVWLDPRPVEADLPLCYPGGYFTHRAAPSPSGAPAPRPMSALRDALRYGILCGGLGYRHLRHRHTIACRLGPLLGMLPALKTRATFDLDEMCPPYSDGLLVDVGCGKGDYLQKMRGLGWRVLGVEPDPAAAAVARARGLDVVDGFLEAAALPEGGVDVVTMNNVIEHLPDPRRTIRECGRVLRASGRLVIDTPNAASLGHRVFGNAWYPLDPPRHLFLFSPGNIGRLLGEAFAEVRVATTARGALYSHDASVLIESRGRIAQSEVSPQPGRRAFARRESLGCLAGRPWGEELEVVAIK